MGHDAEPTTPGTISPESIPSTGLSVVYEPPNDKPVVDNIMVHGLKGHPYKTWRFMPSEKADKASTHSDNGILKPKSSKRLEFRNSFKTWMKGSSSKDCLDQGIIDSPRSTFSGTSTAESTVFWPADLLPQLCKNARILTFGYDTKVTKFMSGPTNMNSIFSHGKDFLFSLGRMRVPERPIIFIAHSLGDILVKEMLALSSTSDINLVKGIVECTAAVIFLGTPHRGSPELSAIGEWARSVLNSFHFQTTSAILDALGLKTTDHERAHEAFSRLWLHYDFRVKTFQEGFGLTGIKLGVLGNKVVPHDSSLIGDSREHAETLQANHMEMSRFSSSHDPNFVKVAGEIVDIYTAVEREQIDHIQTGPFRLTSEASPAAQYGSRDQQNVIDKKMLSTLIQSLRFSGMDTRRECISLPSINTGQWLFQNPIFRAWQMSNHFSKRLLFIKGKPGAGKLTLMKEAARRTRINLESEAAIVLMRNMREKAALSSKEWSDQHMESLLTDGLEVLSCELIPVYIFVDALDELGSGEERHVVAFWMNHVQSQIFRNTRVCLSCRHFPNISTAGCLELVLDAHNSPDILTYINLRLKSHIHEGEEHWRTDLSKKIFSMSTGVFLLRALVRLVEDTPTELKEVYAQIISTLVESEKVLALRLFQWVTGAARPLRLDEWHHVLAFIATRPPKSLKEWRESLTFTENDHQLERMIKTLSRGLLEISNSQSDIGASKEAGTSSINAGAGSLDHEQGSARVVQVIHESVYDFLMLQGGFELLGWTGTSIIADCHCMIAITCLNYMNIPELDDLVVARQLNMIRDVLASSKCSSLMEELQDSHTRETTFGPKRTLDGLVTLPRIDPQKLVEAWVWNEHLASCSSSIRDTAHKSTASVSTRVKSQALKDYPALLLYAASELDYHIHLADSATSERMKAKLHRRLWDEELKKRLAALDTKMWVEKDMIEVESDISLSSRSSTFQRQKIELLQARIKARRAERGEAQGPRRPRTSFIMGVFTKFRFFNRRLALSCVLIAVSTFNYGFDNQAFATTQAMDAFDKQFGVWDEKTGKYVLEPSWLSLFNSLNYIGFAAGVLIGTWISSRWGRRWCMFVMSVYAIGTATIAVTSFHREQIMAARILNYVYVGMELGVVPTFQSEIVPAQARGFMVGSYQLSLAVGGLVINSICFGTSSLPDNRAWRIPLGMFYIVPSIVVAGIWFVPESPRWLLRKNRVEEARKSLQKIREGAFTNEEIDAEFTELKVSLEQETEQGKFVELVRGINLKRTLIVMAVNFYQQAGGQAFVSQYGTIYVKSLGTINPFGFSLITSAISIISITCILLWTDIVGRRVLMMASSVTMFAAMITMGGLGIVAPVDDSRKKGVISMMAVFASGFGMGWAPLVYVVTTELSALRLRDLTSRVGFTTNVIMNFAVNFSIPYLIYDKYAGLNSKVGFIFGGIMATALVFVYFCVPECKGKTLEQVDFLFNQGVPIRQFGKVDAAEMMRATQEDDGLGKLHSDGKDGTVTAEERV
ncbi:RGT2-Sensor of high external glucose concentration [Fusarium circinatum]|uniref:RGT2-Sensor of high external glucose concentration n=1 Tax=Fusarium circinatum TaxID=48490 RepID=A0A8H5T6G6_FUSCI|nr:RGT2-Sensor of high external glucose concentration [Fusarium circinatum]